MRALLRRDQGAAAIEYALIGALIGLGLVGSLMTTKGSLSAIFGTAATQMAGAPTLTERAAPAASTSSRAPFWNAKTLTSSTATQPDPLTRVNSFTYSDGASAILTRKYDASGALTGETLAVNRPQLSSAIDSVIWTFDAAGKGQSQDQYWYYSVGGPTQLWSHQTAASGYAVHEIWYNSDGSVNHTYDYPPGYFKDLIQPQAYQDEIYFRSLSIAAQ